MPGIDDARSSGASGTTQWPRCRRVVAIAAAAFDGCVRVAESFKIKPELTRSSSRDCGSCRSWSRDSRARSASAARSAAMRGGVGDKLRPPRRHQVLVDQRRSVIISLVSGSACSAFGSRSVDSCSALKPRISVRPRVVARAALGDRRNAVPLAVGDLGDVRRCRSPTPAPRRSARRSRRRTRTPSGSCAVCHRKRVSTLRPLNENSFQNFVPTGSSHFARSATLICDPTGNRTQRRFVAPSLHSGYCGENGRLRASIFSVAASE